MEVPCGPAEIVVDRGPNPDRCCLPSKTRAPEIATRAIASPFYA